MNSPTITLKGTEKIVVTENGARVGPLHSTVESAQAATQERKKLAETAGSPAPAIEIKRQLFG